MSDTLFVADDMVVGLHYTLRIADDDEIADSTLDDSPLWFIQGRGHVIPGLEQALYGLEIGAERQVTVGPELAYGPYDEDAVQALPRSDFPPDVDLAAGLEVELVDEEDDLIIPAYIMEIGDEEIVLNLNHPLAGETLQLDVKIAEIRPATPAELDHDHVHLAGQEHEA